MLIPGPIGSVLRLALFLFFIVLIGRLILDWVQAFSRDWRPRGPMLVVAEVVYTITDPPLRALRKVIRSSMLAGEPRSGMLDPHLLMTANEVTT
jgi:YggT family protein